MKKPDPNIFEESARRAGKKKKKKTSPPPVPASQPADLAAPPKDEEVTAMFKRIRDMENDLTTKMDNITELSGMSRKELRDFIDNPANFTPEQWEAAHQEREALENRVVKEFGVGIKKKAIRKKKKKLAKGRRGKTLGARKGWIPM